MSFPRQMLRTCMTKTSLMIWWRIKTKKWTVRFFDHIIDMAVCNSWLEYIRDCEAHDTRKKDRMDLLDLKNDIAYGLIAKANWQPSKKRGRPRKDNNDTDDSGSTRSSTASCSREPSTSRTAARYEINPKVSVRYDQYQHWPEFTTQKTRCKMPGCTGWPKFKCTKCNVHLCVQKKCFQPCHMK